MNEVKNVYSFEDVEKNEELKRRVLEKNLHINVMGDWYQFILEEESEKLEKKGYFENEISFSGFHSQGDGASFVCNYVDIKKIINKMNLKIRFGLEEYLLDFLQVKIERISSHYYHYNTVEVKIDYTTTERDNIDAYLEDIIDDIVCFVEFEATALCKEIYEKIKEGYEGLVEESIIMEILEVSGYKFLENGEIL